jgi:hypothetical protein
MKTGVRRAVSTARRWFANAPISNSTCDRSPSSDRVPLRHLGRSEPSKIEDFFAVTTKAKVIDGKTFNDGNDFDVDKHSGKKVFAHRVMQPKADKFGFPDFARA